MAKEYTDKDTVYLNKKGNPIDYLNKTWSSTTEFDEFFASAKVTVPNGTKIRIYNNGNYTEKFWNGTEWKEVTSDIKSDLATIGQTASSADTKSSNAKILAEEAKTAADTANTTATQAKNEAHDASVTALDAQEKATANTAAINAAKTELAGDIDEIGTALATVTNVTIPGINKTISDNARTAAAAAAAAQSSADAAQTIANGNKNNISANAAAIAGHETRIAANTAAIAEHKSKLDTLKPIDQEDFDVSYTGNGASVSARGKKLFDIAAVDNVDAGLMTPAMLEHVNQLTNLQGAKFIGIYINEDSGDAIDEAKAYYASHCESGEVVWFLFGTDITSLYVASWDGTTYRDLDDEKSYDFTDFNNIKQEIKEMKSLIINNEPTTFLNDIL